jgi:putative transposase
MARLSRVVIPEYPHHVTQRGVRSMDIFYSDRDYEIYLEFLKEYSKKFELEVISYCLMTNHVHLIVIPFKENSISKAIGETHRNYTRYINFKEGVRGHLFQGRFFSTPMDESHFYNCLKYVEQNPVRANMVKYPWEYEYSSARYRVGLEKKSELLKEHNLLNDIDNYKEFIKLNVIDIDILREKTRTGRPYGSDEFYEFIKVGYGKDVKPRKPGPKNSN